MIEHLKNYSGTILIGIIISFLLIELLSPLNSGAVTLVIIISFAISFTTTRGVSYVFKKFFKKS